MINKHQAFGLICLVSISGCSFSSPEPQAPDLMFPEAGVSADGSPISIHADRSGSYPQVAASSIEQNQREEDSFNEVTKLAKKRRDENSALVKDLNLRGADVRATRRGVVINIPDAYFEFDKYVLTEAAIRAISEITDVLKSIKDRQISVEGHADSIGRVSYNKKLSQSRANAVASELRSKGLSSLKVIGYGEGYPIATNNTEKGQEVNRRVEIVIEN